jgi:NMD protein affecting ribosome stability and mRNA decay
MFKWITKNHEIVVGFKSVKRGKCSRCGKAIPLGNNICDECFREDKKISKK